MKKFAKAVLGLSLVVGSASFAQSSYSDQVEKAFYPTNYADKGHFVNNTKELAKSSISNDTFKAFYTDNASEYSQNSNDSRDVINSAKSQISANLIKELYTES